MPDRSRRVARARRSAGDDDASALEREIASAALAEDIAAGLAPVWAARPLHPHEIAARVSFAAIDQAQQLMTQALARRLVEDRARFLELLAADLAGQRSSRAIAERLVQLEVAGIIQVAGVADLVNATANEIRAALLAHADVASAMAVVEAAGQGAAIIPAGLDASSLLQIDQLAHRLAVAPHVDVVRALALEAVRLPVTLPPVELIAALSTHGAGLSSALLEDGARSAVAQADGLGRQAAASTVTVAPAQIYASELLDGNTCGPCSLIDGREFASRAEARVAYPNGTYVDCSGGIRCRGTLVYIWPAEAPPSVAR